MSLIPGTAKEVLSKQRQTNEKKGSKKEKPD
jgi:hypothetical protein